MPFATIFLLAGLIILTSMVLLWLLSLITKNASIVDIFWGIGFVVIVWFAFTFAQGYIPRKNLICTLTTIWGMRLALHIGIRNWGKPEDFRYAKWRADNGPRWWWFSFLQVFLLQGVLLWIIGTPLIGAQTSGYPAILTPLDFIGVALWFVGFLFEAVGDFQLARFKSDPSNKGKLLTNGIWRYTRHPNYFGDAIQWWGFYFIALAAGAWWTVFSPILMTWLLMRVSGVAMLERAMKLKPGYEDYMRKTNPFFPWFPKS